MRRRTAEDLAWARTGKKPIHAVRWTDSQARIVPTKKRGHELLMVWKKWKQRQGWIVMGNASGGFIATSPAGERHAAAICSYAPSTLERIS